MYVCMYMTMDFAVSGWELLWEQEIRLIHCGGKMVDSGIHIFTFSQTLLHVRKERSKPRLVAAVNQFSKWRTKDSLQSNILG